MYEADLWRIAASLFRDWSSTEALVQHAFMDAYTHLHSYQLGTDFGAWLRTVARNRLRKEFRTASRAEQRLAVYREQLAERLRAEEPGRDDTEVYLAALRNCRAELPGDEAALLRLRYEKGLSFEAIAARRGLTPAAVQRAISRIRFRLRACIEGQLERP
jgi:RNA polymerase sigma-70 factor (ECF subfamily)